MKKIVTGVIFGALLATSAMAETGDNRSGLYLGAGIGNASYSDSDLALTIAGTDVDDKASGVKAYLGYQFNNVIALELGYTDYGKYEAVNPLSDYAYSATSYSLAVNLGYSFWNSQMRPFVNIGLAYLSTKHDGTLKPLYKDLTNDANVGFHYGVGFQYEPDFLYGIGVRIAYEADVYATQVVGGTTDKTYSQTNNMLYAAVQYKF